MPWFVSLLRIVLGIWEDRANLQSSFTMLKKNKIKGLKAPVAKNDKQPY